ncbi:hypothetical protein [Candidatus Vallotia tarda]|nr:hypothetical protein [Candidatus Vallotia tarda]
MLLYVINIKFNHDILGTEYSQEGQAKSILLGIAQEIICTL